MAINMTKSFVVCSTVPLHVKTSDLRYTLNRSVCCEFDAGNKTHTSLSIIYERLKLFPLCVNVSRPVAQGVTNFLTSHGHYKVLCESKAWACLCLLVISKHTCKVNIKEIFHSILCLFSFLQSHSLDVDEEFTRRQTDGEIWPFLIAELWR